MDFALTEEQQLIITTTRDFVRQELVPHEQRGRGQRRAARGSAARAQGRKRSTPGCTRPTCPPRSAARGLDAVSWVLYEKELGLHQLRAALRLRGAALQHPAGLRGRAARALPAARGARRARRMPGDDRAAGRLRPAQHEDQRGARRAGTSSSTAPSTSSVTPIMPISSSCSPPAARRACRAASASSSPRSWSTRARRASRCCRATSNVSHRGYTNSILQFSDCRVPQVRGARARCTRASRSPTPGWAPRACRSRPTAWGAPSARSSWPSSGRWTACSSGSRSASSRAWPSSWPTWRWSCARRSC